MKKLLLILLLVGLTLCASACDGMFDNDFLSVSPHDEQYTLDEGSDALTAENYLGLKNAILSFVENHTEYGAIRIYHYDGEVESDLADAAYEVAKSDPLGAYAVDYMTHDCTLIVSYYEIHIYITFARTQEEIEAVERVNSVAALRSTFEQALLDGVSSLALRVTSYSELDYTALMRECYEGNPRNFAELPSVSVELYPSTGVQRILQFTFLYETTQAERVQNLAALEQTVSALSAGLGTEPDEDVRFEELAGRLLTRLSGAAVDEQAILYDVLCRGEVNSESLSLTLRVLAEEAGLSCITVSGRRNNVACAWNIVTLNGVSYHVDLLRDLTDGSTELVRYSDSEMEEEYTWERESVPACEDRQPEQPADFFFAPQAGSGGEDDTPDAGPDASLEEDPAPAE